MDFNLLDQWLMNHGLPVTITVIVIYLLFKYFMNQINRESNPCQEQFKKNFTELNNKIDKINQDINKVNLSISNLKGLLSGIFFRNSGGSTDND